MSPEEVTGDNPEQDLGAREESPHAVTPLEILSYFAHITSISELYELIRVVIEETPRLINAAGCSIYLTPEHVPQYKGNLIDHRGKAVRGDAIKEEFIVLAATSRPNTEELVGKAFYPSGSGLSGWVFKHGEVLRLENITDEQELRSRHPELRWTDRYRGSQDYYQPHDKKPILIVPMIADGKIMGILKLPATLDKQPFTAESEQIAQVVAQTIAAIIRSTWVVKQQGQTIHHLVEIGAQEEPDKVFATVTKNLAQMLNCRRCQLYLRADDDSHVRLRMENGKPVPESEQLCYKWGESLTGWVFKTGKPLLIDDVRDYATGRRLSNEHLEEISDGRDINGEDRFLKWERKHYPLSADSPSPFLAVPIRERDGSVQGVLCAQCGDTESTTRTTPFSRTDLQMAQSFATTTSLALENERAKRREKLLVLWLGYEWELADLFFCVIDQVPRLVSGSGCSIYQLESGRLGASLHLVRTSKEGLADPNGIPKAEISYSMGEGKTGFCALAKATLIVNHYGVGVVARQAIQQEKERIARKYHWDLVEDLYDEQNRKVGLIHIRQGWKMAPEALARFRAFRPKLAVGEQGLPSPKMDIYRRYGSRPSWSAVAVPIKHPSAELYGVITIGRPMPRNPFSRQDVSLLESIAGQLAAGMMHHKMVDQREQLFMTLAHEINTPIVGILADTENIMNELPTNSELKGISKHNLEQVEKLQMLVETILAVMSGQTPEREFEMCGIDIPLKSACELFRSEAMDKGLIIYDPRPFGDPFPEIEMSRFDLEIAFKNLVHNAIKYSFRPSPDQQRWIRITGQWANQDRLEYVIIIENYGVGITDEEIKNRLIFEPYYRGTRSSDRRRTGAGLGLAYARQIIEDLHHGIIAVTSEPMPGAAQPHLTSFIVILPVRQSCLQ